MMIAEAASTSFRRILVPLAAGLLALAAFSRGPAQAETKTFILGPHDGYGIAECFVDGVACGKTVANAWCESQGRGQAVAFGLASDVTASIATKDNKPEPKIAPGSVVITCAD